MAPRRYSGPAALLDQAGEKIADVRLIAQAARHDGAGVLPTWDGERLDGRPAWKGTAVAAGIDWAAVVGRGELIVVVHGRTSPAIPSYCIEGELKLEGGPPVPF